MMGPCAMERGLGGRPEQPHAAVPLSGRRSAGASVRPPRTPGSPSSAAHAGGVIACLSRMRGRRPSRFQVGGPRRAAPVPIWPPAKPRICRPDAATTWRGPTAPMRGPTWAGLHSRMWRFPWTVPGPVDTSSRPGCANRDRALHGVDDAPELHERAVAHQLDRAPVMRGDGRLDQVVAQGLEPGVRAGLVGAHKARIANHV